MNRVCAVICFHNYDEMYEAAAVLTEQGSEVIGLDEIDDESPHAIWVAVNTITDLDHAGCLDRVDLAVRSFHGVIVETESLGEIHP